MSTTESLYSASSREEVSNLSCIQACFSRLRPRPRTRTRPSHCNTIHPRRHWVGSLPQGDPGLWGTRVGPGRTPTVHRCPEGKAVGGPQLVARQTIVRQTTSLETNVLSVNRRLDKRAVQQPGADSHLESYMVAEQRDNHMADESKWRSPGLSRRSRRETKPLTPEKINQETEDTKQNETEHIKIRRINTRTELLMCLLQCSGRSLGTKRHTERVGQRDSTSEFGLDLWYSERAY